MIISSFTSRVYTSWRAAFRFSLSVKSSVGSVFSFPIIDNNKRIIIKIESLTSIKVTLDNLPNSNAIGGASYSSLSVTNIIDLLTIHQNNWKSRLRYIRLNSAVEDLKDNWEDYTKELKEVQTATNKIEKA